MKCFKNEAALGILNDPDCGQKKYIRKRLEACHAKPVDPTWIVLVTNFCRICVCSSFNDIEIANKSTFFVLQVLIFFNEI